MEQVTPKLLYEFYVLLSKEDQDAFLRLLGGALSAEALALLTDCLTRPERFRYSQALWKGLTSRMLPLLIQEGWRLSQLTPVLPEAEAKKRMEEAIRVQIEGMSKEIADLERDQLKEKRDRKSEPATIRRNIEICDLRKQNPRRWSQSQLGKRYGITPRAIRKILAEEDKWRQLASRLRTK